MIDFQKLSDEEITDRVSDSLVWSLLTAEALHKMIDDAPDTIAMIQYAEYTINLMREASKRKDVDLSFMESRYSALMKNLSQGDA